MRAIQKYRTVITYVAWKIPLSKLNITDATSYVQSSAVNGMTYPSILEC